MVARDSTYCMLGSNYQYYMMARSPVGAVFGMLTGLVATYILLVGTDTPAVHARVL